MATAFAAEPGAAGSMVPAPFRVVSHEQDTADTWTIALEPLSGGAPAVAPGQFMMVYAFGTGEVPISVSGLPLLLTVRAVGAVTRAVCAAGPGTVLGLRGPFGNAWPIDEAAGSDVVVIAGGIGLAPLRPLVLRVLAERDRYGAVTLLYGARTPADLLYPRPLHGWRRHIDVAVTVDSAGGDWSGHVGVVTKLLGEVEIRPGTTSAFVCGPEIMMRFAARALLDRGVAAERIAISMERHMECGIGLCGHCQLGPTLICRDGPVYTHAELSRWLEVREL